MTKTSQTINNELNLIRNKYGIVENPKLTIMGNMKTHFGLMNTIKLKNNLTGRKFHNLCTHLTPPLGCGDLLTLGLKFCIEDSPPKKLDFGIQKLGDSLQKRWNLALPANATQKEQI